MYIDYNLGNILSRHTCAMQRQGPIPLSILVHLSSNPSKVYITYFMDIYFTCIIVEMNAYENILSLDTMIVDMNAYENILSI